MTSDELQAYLNTATYDFRIAIEKARLGAPNADTRVWELCFDALAAAYHQGHRAGSAEGRAAGIEAAAGILKRRADGEAEPYKAYLTRLAAGIVRAQS